LVFAAGLGVGLGDAVTVALALAFVFEFSAVLQAAPKTAKANKARKPVIRRMSVPPGAIKKFEEPWGPRMSAVVTGTEL
jgi:hypothetical protein